MNQATSHTKDSRRSVSWLNRNHQNVSHFHFQASASKMWNFSNIWKCPQEEVSSEPHFSIRQSFPQSCVSFMHKVFCSIFQQLLDVSFDLLKYSKARIAEIWFNWRKCDEFNCRNMLFHIPQHCLNGTPVVELEHVMVDQNLKSDQKDDGNEMHKITIFFTFYYIRSKKN